MRINRVRVQGFRCLEDVDVPFGDVTTLIGPNGVGKSSLLRALVAVSRGDRADVVEQTAASGTFGVGLRGRSCRLGPRPKNDRGRERVGRDRAHSSTQPLQSSNAAVVTNTIVIETPVVVLLIDKT